MTRIFISHSHTDREIASELVDFLLAALELRPEDIRCTSVPGHQLPFGSSIGEQLKKDLNKTTGLIALITQDSLRSTWVLFELGSSWATEKLVVPILGPGLTYRDLPGPLAQYPGVRIEDENPDYRMTDVINQLASNLEIRQETNARRDAKLDSFISKFKAWRSQLPEPDPSQQKQIEELTKKLKESKDLIQKLEGKERLHKKQLEEMKTGSQQEKEELERNYQNQKQKLDQLLQSLQSEIKQLKEQLDQERAQNETDQNEIMRLRELIERSQVVIEDKEQDKSQAQSFTEDLGNDIKLEMIAIPAGKFMMGSPEGEGEDSEKPQHEVTVQPFFMGKYPITQAQYQQIMGNNPSDFKGDERPVECLSWDEAIEFCQRLSKQTGKEYRLPSEADWEYACRSRTTTKYYFGDDIASDLANYGGNIGETTSVGKYSPNDFGLYDMHGNVFEWCQDDWHKNYKGAPNNGNAWLSGISIKKVIRGGSWWYNPSYCRSAYRDNYSRDYRPYWIGFRVVCVAPRTT